MKTIILDTTKVDTAVCQANNKVACFHAKIVEANSSKLEKIMGSKIGGVKEAGLKGYGDKEHVYIGIKFKNGKMLYLKSYDKNAIGALRLNDTDPAELSNYRIKAQYEYVYRTSDLSAKTRLINSGRDQHGAVDTKEHMLERMVNSAAWKETTEDEQRDAIQIAERRRQSRKKYREDVAAGTRQPRKRREDAGMRSVRRAL